jgi:hypothetical protein
MQAMRQARTPLECRSNFLTREPCHAQEKCPGFHRVLTEARPDAVQLIARHTSYESSGVPNQGDRSPSRRSNCPIWDGTRKSCGIIPATIAYLVPSCEIILVRLTECSVSTPVCVVHPLETAQAMYCANVGWPPNGNATRQATRARFKFVFPRTHSAGFTSTDRARRSHI